MFDANYIDAQHQAENSNFNLSVGPRIRIDAALDLRDAAPDACRIILTTSMYAPHHNRGDGHQPNSKIEIDCIIRHPLPDEFLVELTGIEPVASWLQTRRSPS